MGAAGTGKSTIAAQFVAAAAARGQRASMFLFDERPQTLLSRCADLQVDLDRHVDSGLVTIQQVDPVELAPGEFIHAIRHAVERGNARVIVIPAGVVFSRDSTGMLSAAISLVLTDPRLGDIKYRTITTGHGVSADAALRSAFAIMVPPESLPE